MSYDLVVTLGVTGLILLGLIRNKSPDAVFLGGVGLLALAGVITPKQAVSGFANQGVLTVTLLFILVAGLRETGVLDFLGTQIFGRIRGERGFFPRLAAVTLPLSAFLNNTPIVSMLMPIVIDRCRKLRISPSKFLIPLSYLSILGGMCTLIGTSTNLVVNGLLIDAAEGLQNASFATEGIRPVFREGLREMGLFEISRIGLPYALVGIIYITVARRFLLPDRKELLDQLGDTAREYLVEMEVQPDCRLAGQTVEDAGLRNLSGLFLIEINRQGKVISPVDPQSPIFSGDRLVFTGIVEHIVELKKIPGLIPVTDPNYRIAVDGNRRDRRLWEAVVSHTSPLVGKTIADADFRVKYNAAVVAVHRNGERIRGKMGEVTLQPGDTLLLQASQHFRRAHRNNPAFYLVSNVAEWRPLRRDRAWIAVAAFAAFLVAVASGLAAPVTAAAVAAIAIVGAGCISMSDARQSIDWQVFLTIAAALGVGAALKSSGAAGIAARELVAMTEGLGPIAAMICLYLMTFLLTELITNNAAAILMFPICLETARLYEVSPRPFVIALIVAASASFMTPIGYQTNLMVYGPGGYKFRDFVKIGLPLNLLLLIVGVTLIPMIWPFQP